MMKYFLRYVPALIFFTVLGAIIDTVIQAVINPGTPAYVLPMLGFFNGIIIFCEIGKLPRVAKK